MNLTRKAIGGRILAAAKKDTILTVSLVCAVFSMFLVPPSAAYIGYVDFRVLALLFCLMVVVAGFQECGLFVLMARKLLSGENNFQQLSWMLVMLPFFMLAMYEKHGQPLEKIVGNILKVAVIRPKQRPYQTNNFYAVLKRQEMLDKEVYDIVHRNKKMAASDVRENRGKNCAAGKDKEKAVPRR